MCHVSPVTCHMAYVTCKQKITFFLLKVKKNIHQKKMDQVVELVAEGLLSTGPTPSSY